MNEIDNFLASKPFSPTTKQTYEPILRALLNAVGLENLTPARLSQFVESQHGAARRKLTLYACKSFIRWYFGETHPALSVKTKPVKPRLQRTLTADQLTHLLSSFNTYEAKGARDLAICALAVDTGLRLSELCRLRINDFNFNDNSLQVQVKGGSHGSAVFSEQTAAILKHWMTYRKPTPAFFQNTFTGSNLTPSGLRVTMRRWGSAIGIKLSPHDLRRTFATLSLANGASTRVVQLAGRWSNSQMVELYSRALEQKTIAPFLPIEKLLRH
jgi:integrase/recombinase XerD